MHLGRQPFPTCFHQVFNLNFGTCFDIGFPLTEHESIYLSMDLNCFVSRTLNYRVRDPRLCSHFQSFQLNNSIHQSHRTHPIIFRSFSGFTSHPIRTNWSQLIRTSFGSLMHHFENLALEMQSGCGKSTCSNPTTVKGVRTWRGN